MSRNGFPEGQCETRKQTDLFFKEQRFPKIFFNSNFDYCFGYECHKSRKDKQQYTRGNPSNTYILPTGWRRFGLFVDSQRSTKVFNEWHVAYHGTKLANIRSILETGLLIPGDNKYDGKILEELNGHYNDDYKPDKDFDTKQIFVSPSINYASHAAYSPTQKWKYRQFKVAFQLRIEPGSYTIGPKTVRDSNIDSFINDSVLEWSTKDKDAVQLTGFLVQII